MSNTPIPLSVEELAELRDFVASAHGHSQAVEVEPDTVERLLRELEHLRAERERVRAEAFEEAARMVESLHAIYYATVGNRFAETANAELDNAAAAVRALAHR